MSVFLPMAVGLRKAKEMSLTGNFVDAEEALRIGLVNHVVPHDELLPTARRLARDIAGNDAPAVRHLKALYDANARLTVGDALAQRTGRVPAYRVDFDEVERRRAAIVERGRAQRLPRRGGRSAATRRDTAGVRGRHPVRATRTDRMLFPTVTFALFFFDRPADELAAHAHAASRWKLFMLAASYFFYGYWNWHFVLPARRCRPSSTSSSRDDPRDRRRAAAAAAVLIGAIAVNLGVLGYFKYSDFFVTSSRDVLDDVGIDGRQLAGQRRAAGRHLVLHVPGAELRHRRLPARRSSRVAPRLRDLPVVLPAPRRRPDRARQRVPAAARRAEGPARASTRAGRSSSSSSACSRRS